MIAGIDPGKNGGVVIMREDGEIVYREAMPLFGDEIDGAEIGKQLRTHSVTHVFIEKGRAPSFGKGKGGPGSSSVFKFGFVCGIVIGVVKILEIPFTEIPSQRWQKEMHRGVNGKTTKQKSIAAGKRLFPQETFRKTHLSRTPHDGIVEAALIAEYGRRHVLKLSHVG